MPESLIALSPCSFIHLLLKYRPFDAYILDSATLLTIPLVSSLYCYIQNQQQQLEIAPINRSDRLTAQSVISAYLIALFCDNPRFGRIVIINNKQDYITPACADDLRIISVCALLYFDNTN